ncbi:MAG TPA: MFS transporter [Thermoplasmata archaeon]|nr:MFS transporter [Thermoplasmata archaeon]
MSAAAPVEAPPARARLPHDVWAIAWTSLFSDWSYEMLLPILPFFLAFELGASPLVIGVVEGLAIFVQSLAQFVSGLRLAARPDRRSVGTVGYATTTGAHALIALATVWPVVAALRAGAWAGRGERQPIKRAILADASRRVGAGRSFGLEQMFDSLGAVAGTASAAAVVLTEGLPGLRLVFAFSVLPGLVAVVLFRRLVRDQDRPLRAPVGPGGPARPAFSREFRWFLVATTVFGLAFFNVLLGLLRVGTGLAAGGTGAVSAVLVALLAYLLYNLVYAGLAYPSGLVADRFSSLGLVTASFLLFAVVDGLFAQAPSVPVALAAFLLAGAQLAFLDVGAAAWISRAVPSADLGAAFGWFGAVQGGASLVASVLVGALWTYDSAPLAFSVSAVLAIAGAACLAPIVFGARRRSAP